MQLPFVSRPIALVCLTFVFSWLSLATLSGHRGPVPPPSDQWGAPGPYQVTTETVSSPAWPGQKVTVYKPAGAAGRIPVWFFGHGFGGTDPKIYAELLHHLASHGSFVVFSPYPVSTGNAPDAAYEIMYSGFKAAAAKFAAEIDLSRVGFAGHSYGGGAVPALALRGFREGGWGTKSLALYIMAPWFSFFATDSDLKALPAHTQAVIQVFADDTMNDHRIGIDLFEHLPLPFSQKNFVMLYSDRIEGFNYNADHTVPTGEGNPRNTDGVSALDSWGIHRQIQALSDSALKNDAVAWSVVLGEPTEAQSQMGRTPSGRALRPFYATRTPRALYPQSNYRFAFQHSFNPRRDRNAPVPVQPAAYLANLSARATSSAGEGVLIVGATVAGDRPKAMLIRAAGPSLSALGIQGAMTDPMLRLYRGNEEDMTLDQWADAPSLEALASVTSYVGAFPFSLTSKDAALLGSFRTPGLTAIAAPATGGEGVTLVELYDAERDQSARLINLSARAKVGIGENILIAGFTVLGTGEARLLIRGVGPGLAAQGLTEALANPSLTLFQGSQAIASNDDWSSDPDKASLIQAAGSTAGAFPLSPGSKDAALVQTLRAGAYTVQLSGVNHTEGVGLIELYVLP